MLSVKIHFVKSQGIYLESGLVSSFNGWTSQKMHEILLCLTFEAFVDVIWKSFFFVTYGWSTPNCYVWVIDITFYNSSRVIWSNDRPRAKHPASALRVIPHDHGVRLWVWRKPHKHRSLIRQANLRLLYVNPINHIRNRWIWPFEHEIIIWSGDIERIPPTPSRRFSIENWILIHFM